MKFTHFFVERPIFATVISVLIVLVGTIAYSNLPVAQYPEIAPPSIAVTATYPGATAETAANTVATVLEQQINGVENMLYMKSENTADGRTSLNVTFKPGTNLDIAQVLVQNRIAMAEPLLPEEVTRQGIDIRKNSPDLMMVIHILSSDGSRDNLYVSNYARTQVVDRLARIEGVGEARIVAERAYAMRIWIDPERAQAFGMTATEVVAALRENNTQIAAGTINREPIETKGGFELSVETQGRLLEEDEFSNIIVKRGVEGRTVRLRDLARVELAAQDYTNIGYLDDNLALPVVIFQRPGSNALETAQAVRAEMEDIAQSMPYGVEYQIIYDPTEFIAKSIEKIYHTILEAIVLVILVVMVFLQSWRASIIPILAIPVSLIGTFAVMSMLGVSLNNLSLFGWVLAIGIVVDDAIVVVENVERYIREGLSPREAAHKTMDEVGGALVAIAIVLTAVFIPTAFITGISGAFYQQFALTIATATIISLIVSLTLSPALSALLLKPHVEGDVPGGIWGTIGYPFRAFGNSFNRAFEWMGDRYSAMTRKLLRMMSIMLLIYVGLIVLTGYEFNKVPTGFIPEQDQGYLINVLQLPPGATLERTDAAAREASARLREVPGVAHAVLFVGLDGPTFTNASNSAVIFTPLDSFEDRIAAGITIDDIVAGSQRALSQVDAAMAFAIRPPPVRGMGNSGGWKLYVQDRGGLGLERLQAVTNEVLGAANQTDGLSAVFTFFNSGTPRIYADIDRTRAEMLNVPVRNVIDTLEIYLGSRYVNDFNFLNRTYRVVAQADGPYRDEIEDIGKLRTRSDNGAMVPIGTIATFENITGPIRLPHYNLYPAIEVQGSTAPGFSSGESLAIMEQLMLCLIHISEPTRH
jgi:HAE1 family hydrophobic/amphiphilic exporter-1